MSVTGLYVTRIEELPKLFNEISRLGYTIVGYKVINGVLRLREVGSFNELALVNGVEDVQAPGRYSLSKGRFFRHGPDSPKNYLYPAELSLFKISPKWEIVFPEVREVMLAFFGIKPCDLAAIKVMNRVQGSVGDEYYLMMRKNLLTVVENCVEPGATCFCATMDAGPRVRDGFDVAYTRLDNKVVVEAGSDLGVKLLNAIEVEPIDSHTYKEFEEVMSRAYSMAKAPFTLNGLSDILELGIASEVFKEVVKKCLGCANCNMVCPTCFCFDIIDIPHLDGFAERVRVWDGCLNYMYAQVAGGHFRPSLWARYRHFVLHKFAYWIKQFGIFGCVGCGRCITWCPTGIDLRETVARVVKEVRRSG